MNQMDRHIMAVVRKDLSESADTLRQAAGAADSLDNLPSCAIFVSY